MVKKVLLPALTTLAIVAAPIGTVSAHERQDRDFTLRGAGTCQTDGSFKIVWHVKNKEDERLKIVFSSNESVVPDNTKIPAHEAMDFVQNADGTKAATYNLALKGRFIDKDGEEREKEVQWRQASVKLTEACPQPTPISGGQGGGAVLGAQVTAPTGAVGAGTGGGVASSLGVAAVGLTGSLAAAGVGLRRLSRF